MLYPISEPNNRSPLNVEAADLWDDAEKVSPPTHFLSSSQADLIWPDLIPPLPQYKKELVKHYKPIEDEEWFTSRWHSVFDLYILHPFFIFTTAFIGLIFPSYTSFLRFVYFTFILISVWKSGHPTRLASPHFLKREGNKNDCSTRDK